MFWLKLVSKLIGILHSGKDPRNLALGFALGSIIGLTPLMCLHNLVIFVLILILDVSIPGMFLGVFIFNGFAFLLDPLFHNLGYYLLVEVEQLRPFWIYLYNVPFAPLTRFYNTVVLGSFIISLITLVPTYFLFKHSVRIYQERYAEKVLRLKIVQAVKGSNLVQLYYKIKSIGVQS